MTVFWSPRDAPDPNRRPPVPMEEVDMIVVPTKPHGFQKLFLQENRWHAVRMQNHMIARIKWIAAYQIFPISAITHVAPVASIETWDDQGRLVINFAGPAYEIEPIKLDPVGRMTALQNLRYTSLERLQQAKSLDDLW